MTSLIVAFLLALFGSFNYGYGPSKSVWELPNLWQYESGHEQGDLSALPATITLKEPAGTEGITLSRTLPNQVPEDAVLTFVSRNACIEIFIEDRLIYSMTTPENTPIGILLGNEMHLVPLPQDAGGKEIAIRYRFSESHDNTYRIPMIHLGSHEAVTYQFYRTVNELIIFSQMCGFFCLFCLFAALFFKIKKVVYPCCSLVLVAIFTLVATTWIVTDSNLLVMLTPSRSAVYFISNLAFMLIPVPLMLFLYTSAHYKRNAYAGLLVLFVLSFIARLVLFFGGIADLESTNIITHILMMIAAATSIILLGREWVLYRKKTILAFFTSFIALGTCLVLSLFLDRTTHELDYAFSFRILLALMMIAMIYELFSQFAAIAKNNIENQLYQKLAYTDGLTGVPNRMAFEDQLRSLSDKPGCETLSIVIFDINRLKFVNDTYGHLAGDNLIKCTARTIQTTFGTHGKCYRIGGDEFAVILKDYSEASLEKKLSDFSIAVNAADVGNPDGLHVAMGYATCSAEGQQFVYRLLAEADKAMYENKAAQRQ